MATAAPWVLRFLRDVNIFFFTTCTDSAIPSPAGPQSWIAKNRMLEDKVQNLRWQSMLDKAEANKVPATDRYRRRGSITSFHDGDGGGGPEDGEPRSRRSSFGESAPGQQYPGRSVFELPDVEDWTSVRVGERSTGPPLSQSRLSFLREEDAPHYYGGGATGEYSIGAFKTSSSEGAQRHSGTSTSHSNGPDDLQLFRQLAESRSHARPSHDAVAENMKKAIFSSTRALSKAAPAHLLAHEAEEVAGWMDAPRAPSAMQLQGANAPYHSEAPPPRSSSAGRFADRNGGPRSTASAHRPVRRRSKPRRNSIEGVPSAPTGHGTTTYSFGGQRNHATSAAAPPMRSFSVTSAGKSSNAAGSFTVRSMSVKPVSPSA